MRFARASIGLQLASALLFALAWLVPNHYYPWTTFHNDWLAFAALIVALLAAMLCHDGRAEVPWSALIPVALASICGLQWCAGMIYFGGDALMAALYLLALAGAVAVGYSLALRSAIWLDALAGSLVIAGLISAAIAGLQWLQTDGLGLFIFQVPPGGRPFANLAQPNQLATVLALALVCSGVLYERRRIGHTLLAFTALILSIGIVLTQSRAAWLEVAVIVVLLIAVRRQVNLRLSGGAMVVFGLVFVLLVIAVPWSADALNLAARSAKEQAAAANVRLLHWSAAIDAIARHPWFGFGWNQVAVAIAQVAVAHPATNETIEHSHNLVLDLLIWNGLPIGLATLSGLCWWLWRQVRNCIDGSSAFLLTGVIAALIHAMFEFPLEYAYVLVPVGLMAGVVEALGKESVPLKVPRRVELAGFAIGLITLAWVTVEYVEVEQNARLLRFESARIGTGEISSMPPSVLLLSQLREYLRFARTEAKPGMSVAELDWMRMVAERYGYPPVLFRYALAAAVNGQREAAQFTLLRLCKSNVAEICAEARVNWAGMAERTYPVLANVQFPDAL